MEQLVQLFDRYSDYQMFFRMDLKYERAGEIAELIQTSIDNNKIFKDSNLKPVYIEDSSEKLPVDIKSLSLEEISLISRFCTFLKESRFGLLVTDEFI